MEERLDGTLHITHKEQDLRYRRNHEEAGQGDTGIIALAAREKTMDSSSRPPLEEALSIKEKKAGTAYRCSLKTGHFYFGLTCDESILTVLIKCDKLN